MHELSIVAQIGEIVKEEARKRNAKIISEVSLEIGELAGIELDALVFAWKSIQSDVELKDTVLHVDTVPGKAMCLSCNKEFDLHEFFDVCPECLGFENEVIQGREMKIKSIEIEC